MLGELREVQPQKLRRLLKAGLLPVPKLQGVLGIALQVAVAGEKGHVYVAAEIAAVVYKGQNVRLAPGHEHAVPKPAPEAAHGVQKWHSLLVQVLVGYAGQVRHHGVQMLAHLRAHETGEGANGLKVRAAFHRAELDYLVYITPAFAAVGCVPLQVQYGYIDVGTSSFH